MTAAEDATSPNFGFLAKRYPELERIAARSERYFSDDPVVSLITLRQFGEALAQLVAARSGLYTDPNERQRDLLRRLRVDGRYPSNVLGLFDRLRKDGNAAAHHHAGDHAKALACLKRARQLGIWFYRTFDNHNFKPRPFQPPRPLIDATTELTAETSVGNPMPTIADRPTLRLTAPDTDKDQNSLDRSTAQRDAALSARTGRMSFSPKYAFVLALAAAVIYVYAPLSHEDIAKFSWLDDINVIINKSVAPLKREERVSRTDPVAAANVDEDLDYRIAQRLKSIEGWRSFLAAHTDGAHAQSARAELEKLVPADRSPAAAAAQDPAPGALASDVKSLDRKAPSGVAFLGQSSSTTEVATPITDEVCRGDEDRLERLSITLSSDEGMRFLKELRCEKLRPQLFRLTERLDYQDSTPAQEPPRAAVATQGLSSTFATRGPTSRVGQAKITSRVASASVARRRPAEPQNRARWSVASRSLQPRRPAKEWTSPSLPRIFLAMFGGQPKNSTTFLRTRASGGGGGGK